MSLESLECFEVAKAIERVGKNNGVFDQSSIRSILHLPLRWCWRTIDWYVPDSIKSDFLASAALYSPHAEDWCFAVVELLVRAPSLGLKVLGPVLGKLGPCCLFYDRRIDSVPPVVKNVLSELLQKVVWDCYATTDALISLAVSTVNGQTSRFLLEFLAFREGRPDLRALALRALLQELTPAMVKDDNLCRRLSAAVNSVLADLNKMDLKNANKGDKLADASTLKSFLNSYKLTPQDLRESMEEWKTILQSQCPG